MRQMLQENPGQLQVLKQQLQAEHPDLAKVSKSEAFFLIILIVLFNKMIGDNPQQFLDLLNQAGGPGNDQHQTGAQAPGAIEVNLSPHEQQAITRVRTYFIRIEKEEISKGSNLT
jgi:hypothetical protein